MANTKTAVALAPAPDDREIAIDRKLVAPPANLTNTITGMMEALKNSISAMDDMTCEIALHSDQTRSSAHVKFRAYKHRRPDAAQ
jgi:hypothetical protein